MAERIVHQRGSLETTGKSIKGKILNRDPDAHVHARTSRAPGVSLGESPIIAGSRGSARMNIQPRKRVRKGRDERLTRRVTGEQNTDPSPFFLAPAHREDSETGTGCDVGI